MNEDLYRKVLNELIELADKNPDGFTAEKNDYTFRQIHDTKLGKYVVSLEPVLIFHRDDKTIEVKEPAFTKYILNQNYNIVGGWFDKETNCYLVECNETFDNIIIALHVAKLYNQKYIFDLDKKESLSVDKYDTYIKKLQILKNNLEVLKVKAKVLEHEYSYSVNNERYNDKKLEDLRQEYNDNWIQIKALSKRIKLLELELGLD